MKTDRKIEAKITVKGKEYGVGAILDSKLGIRKAQLDLVFYQIKRILIDGYIPKG